MLHLATETVTYLADIQDPTSDGILTRIVRFGISGMMVLVVLLGAWYAFKAWMDSSGKGDGASMKSLRNIAFGVIVIEAILGGVLYLANYGTGLLSTFGIG